MPSDHWLVVHLRTELERAVLDRLGKIDAAAAHGIAYCCEVEGGMRRVGRLIAGGQLSARDSLDAERLRGYFARERVRVVQGLLSRKPGKAGDAQDGGMLALFGADVGDLSMDGGLPSTGSIGGSGGQ
jgi:hypothetical protein